MISLYVDNIYIPTIKVQRANSLNSKKIKTMINSWYSVSMYRVVVQLRSVHWFPGTLVMCNIFNMFYYRDTKFHIVML